MNWTPHPRGRMGDTPTRRPSRWTPLVVAGVLLVGACGSDQSGTGQGGAPPAGAEPVDTASVTGRSPDGAKIMAATRVATMPTLVTSLVAAADGTELLVGDRSGVVRRLERRDEGGFVVPTIGDAPVLDVSDRVSLQFDRGFLAMALVNDGRSLVVMFTAENGESTLEQYDYEPGAPIDTTTRRELFVLPWPYPWHHGGGLAVDDQGNLLVGIGDKGVSLPGVPGPQDPALLLGGILRIPEAVLADPSREWTPDASEMIARGVRNPWRVSFDRVTGDVWLGDVGDLKSEELNRIPGAEVGSTVPNFGYPYYEGSVRHHDRIPEDADFVPAVVERTRDEGACGMVGGFAYRGDLLPELEGSVVYGDLCSMEVRAVSIDEDGSVIADEVVAELPESIVSFGEGVNGEIYALGYLGGVFRLDPVAWDAPDNPQIPSEPLIPTTTAPEPDVECGIGSAIEPLGFIFGLNSTEVRAELEEANAVLAEKVPNLPPEVLEPGLVIQRVIRDITEFYRSIGWDAESAELQTLRTDIVNAEGMAEGLPDAIAAFYNSRCL